MSKRKKDLILGDKDSLNQPAWFRSIVKKNPTLQLFPHCKLDDGFAQYVIGSDTGCILIWPIHEDTDVDEAALCLEKARICLVENEPCSEQRMVLVRHPQRLIDTSVYEKRNIRCLTERQLVRFALDFFSESKEQIRLGKSAYYQGLYKEAFCLLVNANVDKDADAQFTIGQMYAKGHGVQKDRKKAEEWYWKAANQGHAAAALELEKGINRETAYWNRKEQELIDEIEEFTRNLLEKD